MCIRDSIRRLYEEKKQRFTGSIEDPENRRAQKTLIKELYYLIYEENRHKQNIVEETIIHEIKNK